MNDLNKDLNFLSGLNATLISTRSLPDSLLINKPSRSLIR
jgi:hypothetical protein